jgi:L,D-transpeptidase catalytic domain
MKQQLKGFYLFVSSLVIALLHLPFSFAKSAVQFVNPASPTPVTSNHPLPGPSPLPAIMPSAYDSLHLNLSGLSRQAFDYAKKGLSRLLEEGRLMNDSIISIIDFSQPSSAKRLYILDLKNYKLLFNTLVAHGRNTGREWATYFSNQPASYKSSLGFYITGETYRGNNGHSLKLTGIETGINDKAYDRAIVIHGAGYVSADLVHAQGYIGRSEGCPAIPDQVSRPVINTIKEGSCLFIYHPSYISHSVLLR